MSEYIIDTVEYKGHKINYRTKDGWHKGEQERVVYKNKCKLCGSQLWVTPGGNHYCDMVHYELTTDRGAK